MRASHESRPYPYLLNKCSHAVMKKDKFSTGLSQYTFAKNVIENEN
ncbi:MAG: hypothetical protein WCL00_05900 [Bacteroidota bacterium]